MSTLLTGAVFQHGPREMELCMLLLAIADNADDFGFAFPSAEYLATKARCDVRSVYRYLDQLEEHGWLRRARRLINGKANAYQIDLSKIGVTLSPDARRSPMFMRLCKLHGDTLSSFFSPKTSGDSSLISSDNPQPAQVTTPGVQVTENAAMVTAGVTLTLNPEPSGREPSANVQPNPPTPRRGAPSTRVSESFQALKAALKQQLKEADAMPAHQFKRLADAADDYDTCFRDWWLVDARMLAGEFTLITAAATPLVTDTGVVKYGRRLEMLARRFFALDPRTPVRVTVRHLETQTKTPAA